MSMLIKAGVDISRLKPPIRKRLSCVGSFYESVDEDMIISSTYEGDHGAGSLHYADLAIDFRFPSIISGEFMQGFRACFDEDYDIVTEKDHIHVEYDPK